MRNVIIAASNHVHHVARAAAVLAVCLMFLTVVLQIIARYVFSAPPVWTEDVARYAMVWTGLLGATLSFKTRSDAVLMQSVAPERPNLLGYLAEAVHTAAVLTFVLPVVYFCFIGLRGGFAKGFLARQWGLTADTLGIPMVWISVSVPIAMIIILLHLAARWAGDDQTDTINTQLD
ncbi:TRAP-type C4-dicarboxylate transport system permease small subunit [Primorskyibacter sedentarius]|uniref:TRAP transporter small permease protein n=1 Tax=Primorskyibacter sedentarius TaxID=745311 RepID=A0A4R3IR75_9RHOB|nr:TRAP transporter small permease subunit [Primorskyibacter sedentarius]TCS50804.1 TRAP-type C4-dicarboxylate transport system permease small subunit [Primorskyibacter sedentarius]